MLIDEFYYNTLSEHFIEPNASFKIRAEIKDSHSSLDIVYHYF